MSGNGLSENWVNENGLPDFTKPYFSSSKSKKIGKSDPKNIRLHKTPTGGGSFFYDFFLTKYR